MRRVFSDQTITEGPGFLINNYYFDYEDVFCFTQPFSLKITADNVLPVELNSFTSSVLNNKGLLNWQTAAEVNNYGFEVERTPINFSFDKSLIQGHSGFCADFSRI